MRLGSIRALCRRRGDPDKVRAGFNTTQEYRNRGAGPRSRQLDEADLGVPPTLEYIGARLATTNKTISLVPACTVDDLETILRRVPTADVVKLAASFPETTTTNAPLGPPICTRVPPSAEIRNPVITSQYSPFSGLIPDQVANAIASGRATKPTVTPH